MPDTSQRVFQYQCTLCGSDYPTRQEWKADLELYTDCWFRELTGPERRAIAERVDL